jgi:hypothetical protein
MYRVGSWICFREGAEGVGFFVNKKGNSQAAKKGKLSLKSKKRKNFFL